MDRRQFIASIAATGAASLASAARAQGATIKIIYPFAAGGAGDALARLLAEHIGASLGRSVIVDNRTGGDGRIGVRAVQTATPDGTTLLFTPFGPMVTHPSVYEKLPYDTAKDFAPVSRLVALDFAVAVGPQSGAKTLAEFIAWLKANPGKGNYGVPGAGTVPHFLGAQFGAVTGADMRVITYRGSAPALTEMIGGQIPCMFAPVSDLLEQHRAGAIRILGVASDRRSPFAPDVPTFAEGGVDLIGRGWYALYAPKGAPQDFIDKVNAAARDTLTTEPGKSRMTQFGFEVVAGTPQDLAEQQARDTAFWSKAIKASGFKAEE